MYQIVVTCIRLKKKEKLMRVVNLYKESRKHPVLSFEFSRPKNEMAAANLDKALDSLTRLSPDYISVTFGAGGSNREGSYELVDKLKTKEVLMLSLISPESVSDLKSLLKLWRNS